MKKFKSKKRKRKISIYKIFFLIIITFFFYYIFTKVFFKLKFSDSNQGLIEYMLIDSNHHIQKENNTSFVNQVLNTILKDPITLLKNNLNVEDLKEVSAIIDEEFIDEQSNISTEYVYDPNPTEINDPIIYIYNTHQLENYDSTGYADLNITPNILIASYLLKEELNKLNVKTLVETSNITEFLNLNNWDYSRSYEASRYFVKQALEKYPSLKLVIDLHRDSISREKSTLEMNGKSYAKLLFVVGEEYEGYENNLNLAKTLNNIIIEKYPNLSRGIITRSGKNVNGIYNQDLENKMVLIELGSNENTMEEVVNTISLLAQALKKYIGD